MAINIGNDAVKAIQDLRGNPDFAKLLDALEVRVRDLIYSSIKSPVDQRVHETSMFHGMQEMLDGMSMAFQDKRASQLNRAAPPASPKFRRNGDEVPASV